MSKPAPFEPLPASVWMRPCTRCEGPRDECDLGNGRCAACRRETGEQWLRSSAPPAR